jgi:hypothetical protein
MRDRAIEGLTTLACREDWRSSEHGDLIVGRVKAALSDENPVVRMTATHAFRALYADDAAPDRIRMLGELLNSEPNLNVKNVLLSILGTEAHESPREVDDVLRELANEPKKPTEEAQENEDDNEGADLAVDILTFLTMNHQTPFATDSVRKWAATATQSAEALRAIHFVRDYLAPTADPTVQNRAFDIVATAADTSLERWTRNPEEHAPNADLSSTDLNELKHALKVLESIANQIYFASGAFDTKPSDDAPVPDARHERFADLAVPVLITCARTKVAPIVHHVVETLVFLAPLDERRALLAVAEAVASDGAYAYDSLSSDVVTPYLKRLVAEHRQLVLFDEGGVAAFRKLLSAFASAGNESALELAFTFADVFR